jgi:heme exporter protein CcmD
MDDAVFVLSAWGVTAVSLALYTVRVLSRGRRLSRQVPEERRRWM